MHCLLPKLAARFPAEPELPLIDEPVAETGDGVRVYRRPVLQSVKGTAVAWPPGVRRLSEGEVARLGESRRHVARLDEVRAALSNRHQEVA